MRKEIEENGDGKVSIAPVDLTVFQKFSSLVRLSVSRSDVAVREEVKVLRVS
jgi:hypothetical protein